MSEQSLTGQTLGDYRIGRLIGKGACGAVYRARRTVDGPGGAAGTLLALKVFHRFGSMHADLGWLVKQLKAKRELTLVYVPTQSLANEVCIYFKKAGLTADFYHKERTGVEKGQAHDSFMQCRVDVLVATVAFGMGVDNQHVRHVVHYMAPKTMETYYQELGRAGRDGTLAHATLICNSLDLVRYEAPSIASARALSAAPGCSTRSTPCAAM